MRSLLIIVALIFANSAFGATAGTSPVTANRIITGTGVPSAGTCNTAAAVGKVYIRKDAGATFHTFYVCANTASMTYAWELGGGGGGSGCTTSGTGVQTGDGAGGCTNNSGVTITSNTLAATGGFASGSAPPSVTSGTGGVPFACAEGTVPSVGAASGVDIVYCDSTLHQPLISINNGPFIPTVATTTITTGTSATLATPFTVNEEATAATGVTYTLPTAALGLQFCIDNGYNGSAADTGVLTFATSASGQFMVFTDGTLTATGGNVTSGGAARDGACVYGIDSTHWMFLPHAGTWAKH